jgi:two-component system NtrC family response regulator
VLVVHDNEEALSVIKRMFSQGIPADRPVRMNGVSGNAIIKLPDEGYSLEQLEREIVVKALERNAWNQAAAARFLRIPRHTLIYRLEKYGIAVPNTK